MQINGSFVVNVNINKVWDTMLDIDTIAACIPGVEGKTVRLDKNTFENILSQKVAFMKVKFKTKTVITEKNPPDHLAFVTDGKDTMVGTSLNVKSNVDLKEISPDQTSVSYSADTRIVGKLATFGEGVMRNKSKEIGEQIIKNLKEKIEK
ncbi:MAG: SRPBCC domain-containing protein [Actinobacteria bacterium]|nr:SRPBCC domain-containing protein [Actinomycetota bacterium]MCL5070775.1 SRPBCC domain-containing protein [Actinomycetota bacterium]